MDKNSSFLAIFGKPEPAGFENENPKYTFSKLQPSFGAHGGQKYSIIQKIKYQN